MKTVTCTINENTLKRIIREELERKLNENVDVDHEGAMVAVTGASKLLKAIAAFEDKANGAMMSACQQRLESLKQALQLMVENPSNYTDKVKVEPKRVKLRPVTD